MKLKEWFRDRIIKVLNFLIAKFKPNDKKVDDEKTQINKPTNEYENNDFNIISARVKHIKIKEKETN